MTFRRHVLFAVLPLALLAACGKSAEARYADAQKAFAAENYQAARTELIEALRDSTGDTRLLELQVRTLLRLRDGEGALNALARLKRSAPPVTVPLARYEAEAALLVGAPDDALRLLGSEATPDAWRIRAAAHLAKDDAAAAQDAFAKGMAAGDDPLLLSDYVRFAARSGDMAGARAAWQRLRTAAPGGLDTLMTGGLLSAGDPARAMRFFDEAARRFPHRYEPLLARAEQFEAMDKLPQATKLAEQAAELAPSAVDVQELQLRLLKVTGEWDKLRALLQSEAGKLDPASARGMAYAEAQLHLGQPEQARVTFQRALLMTPGNRYARMMLGRAQTASGDPAAAWNTLRPLTLGLLVQPFELEAAEEAARKAGSAEADALRARRLSPQFAMQVELGQKAMAATAQSRWADAAQAWRALLAGGRDAEIEQRLAWSLARAGRFAEALPIADALLAGDPSNPDLQHLSGSVRLQAGGDPGYAARLLRAAADGAPNNAQYQSAARAAEARVGATPPTQGAAAD